LRKARGIEYKFSMLEPRVYLEVRVLLESPVKAFCCCSVLSGDAAGSGSAAEKGQSCAVCSASADGRPRLDPKAAATAYALAGALGAELAASPRWERFANPPELPPEYAISGLSLLIGKNGRIRSGMPGSRKELGVEEIRVEEYSGRLVRSAGKSRMDYSRAGSPCLRLKTRADFEFGQEAESFLIDLRGILQYLGVAVGGYDAAVRCNAYVCLAEFGSAPANFVKLRNLNSINFVRKAINAEINRQEEIAASGGKVPPESRLWNEIEGRTDRYRERAVEAAARYADSGLGAFSADPRLLEAGGGLPSDLPTRRRERLTRDYGIAYQDAHAVSEDPERALFFDKALEAGAEPVMAARWIATEAARVSRRDGVKLSASGLTPRRFASILGLLSRKEIHVRMAKRLLEAVFAENEDPEAILVERDWKQITDPAELAPIVDAVLAENADGVLRIKAGETAPYEFIIGLVLERTRGQADPARVREILRSKIGCPVVQLLCLGGAILSAAESAEVSGPSGTTAAQSDRRLREFAAAAAAEVSGGIVVRVELIGPDARASEEVTPAHWAALAAETSRMVSSGAARGVVIAHGADTLAYTAALCYWLFADSPVPIVLTAASTADSADEAAGNLRDAIRQAASGEPGVYVAMDGTLLSPLNLKFERVAPDGFRNWNLAAPAFRGQSVAQGIWDADEDILRSIFEDAIRKICVLRVYPGMRSELVRAAIDSGTRYLILELFDSGTANLRGESFSLRDAFAYARRRGVTVFCTSQQEGLVDFGRHSSSHILLRSGAVPMGRLTTESVFTRLIAASLEAESHEELMEMMDAGLA
jgi:aspartyl-tRNA(Asn)/glutamyl-tRNA(Gln) amidotransferase subunit B